MAVCDGAQRPSVRSGRCWLPSPVSARGLAVVWALLRTKGADHFAANAGGTNAAMSAASSVALEGAWLHPESTQLATEGSRELRLQLLRVVYGVHAFMVASPTEGCCTWHGRPARDNHNVNSGSADKR